MAIDVRGTVEVSVAQKAAAAALSPTNDVRAETTVNTASLSVGENGLLGVTVNTAVGTVRVNFRPTLAELAPILADGIKQADYAYTAFGRPTPEG